MLRYNERVQELINIGLKVEYVSEITGMKPDYLLNNYEWPTEVKFKYNSVAAPAAKAKALLNQMSIVKVFKRLKGLHDVNKIYEVLTLKYGLDLSFNPEELLNKDIAELYQTGLSFRNIGMLLKNSNFGFTPDHSNIRKKMLLEHNGNLIKVQTDFKDFNKKEQVKLFKMIKLYKFQPTIGDFNHIYWNYCQGIKPNSVFKLLLEVNEKETKKCIKCKEEFISDGFQRYCPKCARINHNLSKSESYIDF